MCACPGGCNVNGPTGGGRGNDSGGGNSSSSASKVGVVGIVILSM